MHELSICHSIVKIVRRHADSGRVRVVRLRVGELRQIVPDTLTYCWTLVNEGSDLESALLEIERVPATIQCNSCEQVHTMTSPILACPACEEQEIDILSGEEFVITSLELAEA